MKPSEGPVAAMAARPRRGFPVRRLVGLLFLGAVSLRAALPPPAEWKLPPIDGELSGEFNALVLGGAPKVQWRVALRTETPRERIVVYSLDGYGLRVRGEATLDPMGEGTWRLDDGEIDLGAWFGWLAPRLGPQVAAVSVAGTLRVNGIGTWRGGRVGGHATLGVRDGRVEDVRRNVLLEGLACDVVIEDLAAQRTAANQLLTWKTGRYDVVPLGAGKIEFSLVGDKVRVAYASVAVFGGLLEVRELEFSLERPEFAVSAQVTGFELGQMLFLLPEILSEARGRLDGYLELARDPKGIALGEGYLGLREGETAQLRFVPSPGLISSSLPEAINRLYNGLAKMETGGIPLTAELLQLDFIPQGDSLGRSAVIRIVGRPADPSFTGPIDLNVNVRGPIDEVFNTGADFGLRIMGGAPEK